MSEDHGLIEKVPDMLAEVERLRTERDEARKWARRMKQERDEYLNELHEIDKISGMPDEYVYFGLKAWIVQLCATIARLERELGEACENRKEF